MSKGYVRSNSLSGLAVLSLFLTSYIPLFVLIIMRQSYDTYDLLMQGKICLDNFNKIIIYFGMSILCFLLAAVGIIGSLIVFKNLHNRAQNGHTYRVKEISGMNDESLAYMSTYIVPLLFEDYSKLVNIIIFVVLFCVMYRLYVNSKLILVNPILSIWYSIYCVSYLDGDIQRKGIFISSDVDILEDDKVKMYNVGHQLFIGYKR